MTTVFTNGCFDLFHPGHLHLLQRARSFAGNNGRLIVAVNTDSSVRRLKGPERPIIPGPKRTAMLRALRCVDQVEIFDSERNLEELIEVYRPDVLVKGSDYAGKPITGRDLVESWGGQVVLIDLLPGWSTSWLLDADGERIDLVEPFMLDFIPVTMTGASLAKENQP